MSSIKLYNTLSQKKETLVPLVKGQISMYVCGVTVYDHCHLGHARAFVAFDCIRRYLEYVGYEVKFVQNFTDIDDKIIQRSQERELPYQDITKTYRASCLSDMGALNIQSATLYPNATDYISVMIQMIETLISRGHAYVAGGDVCFDVASFSSYGALSKKVLEDLESGARVDVNLNKKNPLDFVLWKASKPGEPFWDSPWGKGRPGWHIECSAMATHLLGPTIDIHAGGADLIFPHHENEIAQSQCATGQPFSTYWMHNGFVTVQKEKMSKSLNNFFTIKDILKHYSGEVVRFFLMKSHYRSPLNYSDKGLEEAKQAYERLGRPLKTVQKNDMHPDYVAEFEALKGRFFEAMNDDFNTAEAIGVLFDLAKLVHVSASGVAELRQLCQVLGLFEADASEDVLDPEVMSLIQQRTEAKKAKDFTKADNLRDQLLREHNILLEDTREGVRWEKQKS